MTAGRRAGSFEASGAPRSPDGYLALIAKLYAKVIGGFDEQRHSVVRWHFSAEAL
jgi:hypothetical protein